MKRFISWLLAVALLLTLAMPVAMAEGERTSGAFTYRIKGNGTAAITGYDWATMKGQDIFIPRMLDGYTVTEIGEEAFANISYDDIGCPIYELSAADCKARGRYAQTDRSNVANGLVIPDTITYIGEKAFFGIELSSYSITIPSSVQYIGAGAFSNIAGLKQFVVNNNATYATIDGILYHKAEKKLVAYPKEYEGVAGKADGLFMIDSFTIIPDGIKEIGDYACFGVRHNERHSFAFCDTIEKIGDYAFASAYFVNHQSVYNNTMRQSRYTETLTLPSSVTEIGLGAFRNSRCSANTKDDAFLYVILQNTNIQEISAHAFEGCYSLYGLTLPTTLKRIEENAFANFIIYNSTNITLPASVEYIGTNAFASALGSWSEKCTFAFGTSSKLSEVAEGAFEGAYIANKLLSLPEGLKTIGDNAFKGIENLTELVIPASVNRIGNNICARDSVLVSTESGSYAAVWAAENGYITQGAGGEDTSWLTSP